MTQLIIEGVALPEVKLGAYTAVRQPLLQDVDMISGRRVTELRGSVWHLDYSIEYLSVEMYRALMSALRKHTDLQVFFLPNNSDDLAAGVFLVETAPAPSFACSVDGAGVWTNVSFSLREVRPSD